MENDENTVEFEQHENETETEDQVEETQDDTQTEESEEESEDTTDWKAEALKYKAILDRNKNKPQQKETKQSKSDTLDWGQKAFLVANGVKGTDEMKLAQDFAKNTGKSLDDIVTNKYFLQELEDFRSVQKTAQAAPKGKGRGSNSSQDTIEYWLAKPFGELPEDFELRKKVVAERRNRSKKNNMFN